MLNSINIMGRLTKNPELRYTKSEKPVASFSIAVERDIPSSSGERQTDFFECVAWGKTGEFISKYFVKGNMIALAGSLVTSKWQDKDGKDRKNVEINVASAYFCESKKAEE